MPYGPARRFDRIGGADAAPMLGRKVMERHQRLPILRQTLYCIGKLGLVRRDEVIEGAIRQRSGFRLPDLVQGVLGLVLGAYVDSLLTRASKLSVQDGSSDQVQSYVRLLDAIVTFVVDREPVWFTCIGSISLRRAQWHYAPTWFCRWRLADSFSPTLSSVLLTHDGWVPHSTSSPA